MPKEKRPRYAGNADKIPDQTIKGVRRFFKKLIPGRNGTNTESDLQTEVKHHKTISCLEYLSQLRYKDDTSTSDNVLQDKPGPVVRIGAEEANVVTSDDQIHCRYRSDMYSEHAAENIGNIVEDDLREHLIRKEECIIQNIHHNETMDNIWERKNKTRLKTYQSDIGECISTIDQKKSPNETMKVMEECIFTSTENLAKQDECIPNKDMHITMLTEKIKKMETEILKFNNYRAEKETLVSKMKMVIEDQREKLKNQSQDHGIIVEHLTINLTEEIQKNYALSALTNTLKLDNKRLHEQIEQLKLRQNLAKRHRNQQRILQRKRSQMKRSAKHEQANIVRKLLATNVYLNCTQTIHVLKCPSDSSETTSSSSRRSLILDPCKIEDVEMKDTLIDTPPEHSGDSAANNEIISQPVYFQTPRAPTVGTQENLSLVGGNTPSICEIYRGLCEYTVEVKGGINVLPLDRLPLPFLDVVISTLACCEQKFGKLLDALELSKEDVPDMLDGSLSQHDKQEITSQALQAWRNRHPDGHVKTTGLAFALCQIIEMVIKEN